MWIVRAYCMRDVCYAGMSVCRYCMLCRYLCAGMVCYAGRAGGTECGCRVCATYYAMQSLQRGENGRQSVENRGIVDILYDGFRKCFVNCKFTFYITLSSYYKKVKIILLRLIGVQF